MGLIMSLIDHHKSGIFIQFSGLQQAPFYPPFLIGAKLKIDTYNNDSLYFSIPKFHFSLLFFYGMQITIRKITVLKTCLNNSVR